MLRFYVYVGNCLESQDGQDLVEYALLVGLIAVICVAAITAAGQQISKM